MSDGLIIVYYATIYILTGIFLFWVWTADIDAKIDTKPYNIICIEGVQHFQTGNETRPVVTVAGRFKGCE